MSLVPLIQPPIMRALTTERERNIVMGAVRQPISQTTKIMFPIIVTIFASILAPKGAPLIGTVMFGLHPDGTETPAALDLVRLAIPRRVYTQSHIDFVAEAVIHVAGMRDGLRGYRITSAPKALRHFTASFAPLA